MILVDKDYKIMEKGTTDYFKINKNNEDSFTIIEKFNPYLQFDIMCAEYNRIKVELTRKANMALMGEIVESTIEKPIIGTSALDTCYGIMFYDRLRKHGILGHAASSSLDSTINQMFKMIDNGEYKIVEYFIVPGFRNVDYKKLDGFEFLVSLIRNYSSNKIRFIPLVGDSEIKLDGNTLSYEFAFDTETGDFVTNKIFFEEIDNNPRFKSKSKF